MKRLNISKLIDCEGEELNGINFKVRRKKNKKRVNKINTIYKNRNKIEILLEKEVGNKPDNFIYKVNKILKYNFDYTPFDYILRTNRNGEVINFEGNTLKNLEFNITEFVIIDNKIERLEKVTHKDKEKTHKQRKTEEIDFHYKLVMKWLQLSCGIEEGFNHIKYDKGIKELKNKKKEELKELEPPFKHKGNSNKVIGHYKKLPVRNIKDVKLKETRVYNKRPLQGKKLHIVYGNIICI